MAEDWITTQQAAEVTGYTADYVRKLAISGKVKGRRWGRDWQIDRRSLLAYVKAAEKLGAKRGPKSGD
jgi:excisionase family DNA binding protein